MALSPSFDLARERAVVRVVLEEVRQRLGVGQVVDPDKFDVGTSLIGGTKNVAANTAKSVDSNFHRHVLSLQLGAVARNEQSGRRLSRYGV